MNNGCESGASISLLRFQVLNDIRQSINEQYSPLGYSVETLSCPKIVEEQPNQPPQDAASKGLYIKSGVLLIVSFLF